MYILAFVISFFLLCFSVPIFLVFGIGSSMAAILGLNLPWSVLIQVSFGALTKHVLIAVPLFIFAGMVMLRGGAATRLVDFATKLVGHPKPFVVVLAASAALLEALIPPSNAAILFSALTNVPVSQTFAAGIVPGLILLLFMVGVVLLKCRSIKSAEKSNTRERVIAAKNAVPALITPGIILGGIYAGLLTPSESAAIAGLWAMIMGFVIYRELTISGLIACLKETASITAVIFAIIATATFLSVVLTYTQLPQKIIVYFTELGAGIYVFWFALALICLILGTFIEIVPVFYLTVPIFAAIITSLNQNLLHLYVVFVAFAGIGMITPPVCVGVYTAAGVIKDDPAKAFKEVPLFVGVGILYGILMIFLPSAATWLPNILR